MPKHVFSIGVTSYFEVKADSEEEALKLVNSSHFVGDGDPWIADVFENEGDENVEEVSE